MAFDPTQFGAVAVEEPQFDPTAHGAVPVEEQEGGIVQGLVSEAKTLGGQALGALNPVNLLRGVLDIQPRSGLQEVLRTGRILSDIVGGKSVSETIQKEAPEVFQQQQAILGKYGPEAQRETLSGIGTQLGMVAAPFIHGKTIPFSKTPTLSEVAGIAKPETPMTAAVEPVPGVEPIVTPPNEPTGISQPRIEPSEAQAAEQNLTSQFQDLQTQAADIQARINAQRGEPNASEITSPESVTQPEVRTQVGEGTPLRQQGETPEARQGIEAQPQTQEVAPREQLFVEFGNERHPVESIEDASARFSQASDAAIVSGGTENVPIQNRIVDSSGKEVGRISPNGRVWNPEGQLIHDPSAPVSEAPVSTTGEPLPKAEPTVETAPEIASEVPRVTSTKNEIVDQERVSRGLQPIAADAGEAHPDTWQRSEQRLSANPEAGKALVDDIITGRQQKIETVDEATLLREKISAQSQREAAGQRALDLNLTEGERSVARREYEDLDAYNAKIDEATHATGSQWSEFGRFRQLVARDDYSLSAVEKRIRIATGGKPIPPEQMAELKTQTDKLTKLQSGIDEATSKNQADQVQRLNERLERYLARRKGLEPTPTKAKPIEGDVETESLRTEIKTVAAQIKEESRLPRAKERLQKKINELENRLSDYGAAKPTKPEPLVADKELRDAKEEYRKVKQKLDDAIYEARLNNLPLHKKIFNVGREILALPRAVMASGDLSGILRQGGLVLHAHPLRTLRGLPEMLKAAKSDQGFYEGMEAINNRQTAPFYNLGKTKLAISDIHGPLTRMEEMYRSRWADSIPIVNHSQRAYVYWLNRIRADTFDAMANTLAKGKDLTPDEANSISYFTNVFTGKGVIPEHYSTALNLLNDVFWAPQYTLSRFQVLTGQPIIKSLGTPKVTKLIAKEYARALTGYAVVYGTVALAAKMGLIPNVTVEYDPRSSDFGKFRIGNTRIDPLAGLSQSTVLMSRLITGKTKSSQTGDVRSLIAGKEGAKYGQSKIPDVAADFLRTKLHPVIGAAVSARTGETAVGEPTTPLKEAGKFVVPLAFSDIYDAMKEQGVPAGAAMGTLAIFGDGLQTYSPKAVKKSPPKKPY